MPTPSQFPALPSSELQDRLRLAKTQFDENVETLRAEFERVLSQAHECVSFFDSAARDALSANVDDPSFGTSLRNYGDANVNDTAHKVVADFDMSTDDACRMHDQSLDSPEPAGEVSEALPIGTTRSMESAQDLKLDCVTAWFNFLPAVVIILNVLAIGISLDFHRGHIVWQILEYLFVVFYSLEFIVKVRTYGCHWYWCGPERMWNYFDWLCLAMMYVDLILTTVLALEGRVGADAPEAFSNLALVKIFRLARLARLIRALRFRAFKELKLIVLGVFAGLRVIGWAIVLLIAVIYAIGVVLRSFLGDDPEQQEFRTVLASMFTCFRCFTDGCTALDGTPLSERLRAEYGPVFMIGYIFIIMLITVGVFNLIMAVFIENVMSSQFTRKQNEISETALQMELNIKDRIIRKLGLRRHSYHESADLKTRSEGMDWVLQAGGRNISREEFASWFEDVDFVRVLDDASIDASGRVGLFDVLDADAGGELSVDELVTGLMSLRGPVTKGDVIGIHLKVRYLVSLIECSQTEAGLVKKTEHAAG
mmetsp:Transcript_3331/g.7852  ORF Transcript_3331/g.7852 Transcript_3331/m.7852 type:complete len:538 (+) Transcript_3331:15-1628(+)